MSHRRLIAGGLLILPLIVGGGKLTAIVRDADGNLLGLIQEP